MTKEKPHNGGQWTKARFNSFIKGALRAASGRWPPKIKTKQKARLERGIYKCAGYKRRWHKVPVTIVVNDKRINNIHVDHITPIMGVEGFTSWDDTIHNMFCEEEDLQILCLECHKEKTAYEKILRKEFKERNL